MNNAITTFRNTFKAVRRNLAKQSGFGFSFAITDKEMVYTFRDAMTKAQVPATPARMQMIRNWVARASKLGGTVGGAA